MISPHAVLQKTKISAMLFCEEIRFSPESCARRNDEIFQDFSENKFQASAELATKKPYIF